MAKKYKTSIFIFRRDLRLEDNTALIEALKNSEEVIPAFIFDPRQIGTENQYRSTNSMAFMRNCLEEVDQKLKKEKSHLFTFFGEAENFVEKFLEKNNADAVFVNKDYTPFSKERDEKIKKICEKYSCDFNSYDDALINAPPTGVKKDQKPYTIFTAYYKNASKINLANLQRNKFHNYSKETFPFENKTLMINLKVWETEELALKGGREEALKLLKNLVEQREYYFSRNYPSKKTSMLSAHLKYGTISIREAIFESRRVLGKNNPLIRQFYWRDFFTQIAYFFPNIFGKNFNKKFNSVKWLENSENFTKWCNGETGFPIVDAGMKELNASGFMHNRVRMICASFLIKDLHIDWRLGEKYFAQKLIDYDPCVNNGNWQWSAGTGCDAAPYFRIFNPWIQQKKFDSETKYIKKWIPQLDSVLPEIIHNEKEIEKYYPPQIVNHKIESKKALNYYGLK